MSDDIERLRSDINNQMSALRGDIKDISKALLELVRLDSVIKNQDMLTKRIGTQVDDHENRIRIGEVKNSEQQSRISSSERIVWLIVTSVFALAFFFIRG